MAKGMATKKKYPCQMLPASQNLISIFKEKYYFSVLFYNTFFSMFVSHIVITFLCCYAIYVSFFKNISI